MAAPGGEGTGGLGIVARRPARSGGSPSRSWTPSATATSPGAESPALLPLAVRRHAAARPLAVAVREPAGDHDCAELDRAVGPRRRRRSTRRASDRATGWSLLAAPSADADRDPRRRSPRAGAVAVPLGTAPDAPRDRGSRVAETGPGARSSTTRRSPVAGAPRPRRRRASIRPSWLRGPPGAERRGVGPRPGGAGRRGAHVGHDRPAEGRAALASRALAASAAAWADALPPATGWLLCLGLAHVAGLGVAWRALGAGVPLHDRRRGRTRRPSSRRSRAADGPSHVSLVPTQLARLLDAADGAPPPPRPPRRPPRRRADPARPRRCAPSGRRLAGRPDVRPHRGRLRRRRRCRPTRPRRTPATRRPAAPRRRRPDRRAGPRRGRGDRGPHAGPRSPATSAAGGDRAAAFTADGWLRTGDLGRLDAAGAPLRRRSARRPGRRGRRERRPRRGGGRPRRPPGRRRGRRRRRARTRPGAPCRSPGIVLRRARRAARRPADDGAPRGCRERLAPYKVAGGRSSGWTAPAADRRPGKLRRRASSATALTPARRRPPRHALDRRASWPRSSGRWPRPGDLRVVAPDRRGSGSGASTRRARSPIDEHVADLAALLDAERHRAGRSLVGHSFGGVVALEAAARLPDRVAAVVAYEPPYGAARRRGRSARAFAPRSRGSTPRRTRPAGRRPPPARS